MNWQMVSVFVSFAVTCFPPLALRYLPYMDKLRIKKGQILAIYAILFLGQILLYLHLNRDGQLNFSQLQMFKFWYAMLYVSLPFVVIRESLGKLLFVWFITAAYINIVARLVTFIELRFFTGQVIELNFMLNNTILCCLLLATWPFVAIFLKRAIVPTLRSIESTAARFIWLVPGLFMLNYTIYVTDLRPEQIANPRYLLLMIPLAGGIGISCYTLTRLLGEASEKARLGAEVSAMNRQLDLQREQYAYLIDSEEKNKAARHDLRHHLAVIKKSVHDGRTDETLHYCDELAGAILFTENRVLCENFAVNATAAHYLALAESEHIQIECRLVIPQESGSVPASDLCILIGNLLENAVEACRRVPAGKRFLHLYSRVQYNRLYITLDNSFDGDFERDGDVWLSRKHDGAGIGLSSIRAVSMKYGGFVKFEACGDIFQSSIMVDMSCL